MPKEFIETVLNRAENDPEFREKALTELRALIDEADTEIAAGKGIEIKSAEELTHSIWEQGTKWVS